MASPTNPLLLSKKQRAQLLNSNPSDDKEGSPDDGANITFEENPQGDLTIDGQDLDLLDGTDPMELLESAKKYADEIESLHSPTLKEASEQEDNESAPDVEFNDDDADVNASVLSEMESVKALNVSLQNKVSSLEGIISNLSKQVQTLDMTVRTVGAGSDPKLEDRLASMQMSIKELYASQNSQLSRMQEAFQLSESALARATASELPLTSVAPHTDVPSSVILPGHMEGESSSINAPAKKKKPARY